MAPKKIQVIPNGDSLKTKWSRAIRYGDLIFTTAHSAARPDGTMPTTPEEQIRGCFESLKTRWKAAVPVWTWSCTVTASWPIGRILP